MQSFSTSKSIIAIKDKKLDFKITFDKLNSIENCLYLSKLIMFMLDHVRWSYNQDIREFLR